MLGEREDRHQLAATKTVDKIIKDLTDRRGLKQGWYETERFLQDKIKETWKDIVEDVLTQDGQDKAKEIVKRIIRDYSQRGGYEWGLIDNEVQLEIKKAWTKIVSATIAPLFVTGGYKKKFKVWWIPQIPGKAFEVEVCSVEEGVKIMEVLAHYDLFQYQHNVKPDYSNAGGLMQLCEDGTWEDWYDDETGTDDPDQWVKERS